MKIKEILNNEILHSCMRVNGIELSVGYTYTDKDGYDKPIHYKHLKLEEFDENKYKASPLYLNKKLNLQSLNVRKINIELMLFGNLYYELGQFILEEFYSKHDKNSKLIYSYFDNRLKEIFYDVTKSNFHLNVYTFRSSLLEKKSNIEIKLLIKFSYYKNPKRFL